MNIPLFRKYVEIYHFFGTRVWRNQVLNGTWVLWKNNPQNSRNFFDGTQVPLKTRFSGTRVSKKWYIATYFQNSGRFPYILPKGATVPFSP